MPFISRSLLSSISLWLLSFLFSIFLSRLILLLYSVVRFGSLHRRRWFVPLAHDALFQHPPYTHTHRHTHRDTSSWRMVYTSFYTKVERKKQKQNQSFLSFRQRAYVIRVLDRFTYKKVINELWRLFTQRVVVNKACWTFAWIFFFN